MRIDYLRQSLEKDWVIQERDVELQRQMVEELKLHKQVNKVITVKHNRNCKATGATVRVRVDGKVIVKGNCNCVKLIHWVSIIAIGLQHDFVVKKQSSFNPVIGKLKRYFLMNNFNLKLKKADFEPTVKHSMPKLHVKLIVKRIY